MRTRRATGFDCLDYLEGEERQVVPHTPDDKTRG
jgi:hypothetical protein